MNVDRVIALLRQLEGWRDYVYDDKSPWPRSEVTRAECVLSAGQYKVLTTGGTATVGYGETGAEFIDRYWGRRITQAEALEKMAERVPGFYQGVRKCQVATVLTEHQWEAITCRAYQTGAGGFCRSDTAELLRAGDTAGALDRWREEFAHPDRSEVEIAHFLTPDEEKTMPRIVSRSEWGARPANGRTPAPGMTRGIGLHHLGDGWGPTGGIEESMEKMRWVQDFHMGPERGWADYAYNAGADHLGNIFEGRGPGVRNAANGGGVYAGLDANAGWFAILYLGGSSGPELTLAAMDAINDYAASLGLAGGDWLGHSDFLSTECPGSDRQEWLDAGHPRGHAAPAPIPQPEPQPEDDDMALFIYDYVPDNSPDGKPLAILYTDGRLKWGVASGEQLAFFATGKVPHLGAKGDQFHTELDWHPGGIDSTPGAGLVEVEAGHYALAGGIDEAMAASPFETGDPGCAGGNELAAAR